MTGLLFPDLVPMLPPERPAPRYDLRKEPRRPRHRDDWYCERPQAVLKLLFVELIKGPALDPCCGRGNIPKMLRGAGIQCLGSDIRDRGFEGVVADFLDPGFRLPAGVRTIMYNPPFRNAQAFVQRALGLGVDKVCALLPLTFLEGGKRYRWYMEGGLVRVWVFSSRESMPPGDLLEAGEIEPEGGKKAFAWFVWERGWRGPWQGGWLP
ncbi:hypothetical protein [Inquilinus sp.]|jgi:hypothetical protein|uniref:hypothetical protein n=1 Tax=Inquilinus sp. TaxID=1932117 RepID=UPI00378466DB